MARAATTLDPFNAVAEHTRGLVLEALTAGEMPVGELVGRLGWPQPMVSKHLGVLKEVGLVTARREGRQRLYRVNVERLKTIHDWAKLFEKFWSHQILRIKERAERKSQEQSN